MDLKISPLIERIEATFPETDRVILAAVVEKRDALFRYLAQVHDLTVAEVDEIFDLVLGRAAAQMRVVLAAE